MSCNEGAGSWWTATDAKANVTRAQVTLNADETSVNAEAAIRAKMMAGSEEATRDVTVSPAWNHFSA